MVPRLRCFESPKKECRWTHRKAQSSSAFGVLEERSEHDENEAEKLRIEGRVQGLNGDIAEFLQMMRL